MLTDTHRSDCTRNSNAAITAPVIETKHQPGLFTATTFSCPQANFLHHTKHVLLVL